MTISRIRMIAILVGAVATTVGSGAQADDFGSQGGGDGPLSKACAGLPGQAMLKNTLTAARGQTNVGFNLDMWGTVVNRDGVVCAVAFTGADRGDQWPAGGVPRSGGRLRHE